MSSKIIKNYSSTDFLKDKETFNQIADEFLSFIKDKKIIIHNAPFDIGFLKKEHSTTSVSDDFLDNDGWVNSKNNGKMRLEGKDYIVKDGDILNIRFNS